MNPTYIASENAIDLYINGRQVGGWELDELNGWTLSVLGQTVTTRSRYASRSGLQKVSTRRVTVSGTSKVSPRPALWLVCDDPKSQSGGAVLLLVDDTERVQWKRSISSAVAGNRDALLDLKRSITRRRCSHLPERSSVHHPRTAAAALTGASTPRPAAESRHSGQVKKWDSDAEYALSRLIASSIDADRRRTVERKVKAGAWGLK